MSSCSACSGQALPKPAVLALAETFKAPRRWHARADARRALAVGGLRLRLWPTCSSLSESAVSHQLRFLPQPSPRCVSPRRAPYLLLPRRSARRQAVRTGARARAEFSRVPAVVRRGPRTQSRDHLLRLRSCTPNRPSRSRAWTAVRKSPCSSGASRTSPASRTFPPI